MSALATQHRQRLSDVLAREGAHVADVSPGLRPHVHRLVLRDTAGHHWATAVVATSVLIIEKEAMVRLLHEEPTFSDRFISYMLTRNMRIEADLVDQLFNSSEKRLARTLLLLARYGGTSPKSKLPKISQETLAEMIGATRSRVNFFMNKFRKLGLIEYNGGLKINSALLSIVLHD